MMKKSLLSLLLGGALALSAAGSAAAVTDPGPPGLSADPTTITTQGSSTITASNLEDGTVAYFSTDEGAQVTDDSVIVENGVAQTTFFARSAGTYTVYLGDGETNFLDVGITVTGITDPGGAEFSADPTVITLGGSSRLTASNLVAGSTAFFSTSEGASVPASQVVAADGTAQATFTATAPGIYTVYLGDGEITIAEVDITVNGLTDPGPPRLTADPSAITTGASSIVTATNLQDGSTAYFSVSEGGSLTATRVTATGGTAQTTFTAATAGTYTVYLGDGETTIAAVQVSVADLTEPTDVADPGGAQLTANPLSIRAGASSTVTAINLEDGATAYFSVSEGGSLTATQVTAIGGAAQTTFTAARAGTYTVYLGDGETTIAEVRITVTAAPIVPVLPATGGDSSPVAVWFGVITLTVGAAAVLFAATRRTRRI
jgi:LPXTG-motif cell wall-anchored protein